MVFGQPTFQNKLRTKFLDVIYFLTQYTPVEKTAEDFWRIGTQGTVFLNNFRRTEDFSDEIVFCCNSMIFPIPC
jgi:hypothetical protein